MDKPTETIEYRRQEPVRLDQFLVTCFPHITRSQIQRLISEQQVRVNGRLPKKTGLLLEKGDEIEIYIPPAAPIDLRPEKIPLDIIYEDQNLLVVNKPAGMVVHPSAGHYQGTLVHALLGYTSFIEGIGGVMRPGIVHRLDKDTSGIILIAKNDTSFQWLQRQFKSREVVKKYTALVDQHPPTPSGRIVAPIYRDKNSRKKMAIAPEGVGKTAETVYHTLRAFKNHTLLDVRPLTGRTHQIRVHLASLGCPICGDRIYGYKDPSLKISRQFLHARELTFRLPGEKEPRTYTAQLPEELQDVLKGLNSV